MHFTHFGNVAIWRGGHDAPPHGPGGVARHSVRAANRVSETEFATLRDCGCHHRFMGTNRVFKNVWATNEPDVKCSADW